LQVERPKVRHIGTCRFKPDYPTCSNTRPVPIQRDPIQRWWQREWRFGHQIHGYCWMSNHIHLAVQVVEVPLSRIMQNLAFRYTRWVNKRQGRVGHLFQGRYKAILVEAESYLLGLVCYIHLNPVRARLVEEPAAYRWSGHRAYRGQAQVSWLTPDWVLSQLTGTERVARRRYAAFIAAGQGEGYREEFHRGTADGRLLGDEDFVAKTLSQVRERSLLRVEPERIIEVVCAHRKIEAGQLATVNRSRAGSEARTLSAYLAVELGAARSKPRLPQHRLHGIHDTGSDMRCARRLRARDDLVGCIEDDCICVCATDVNAEAEALYHVLTRGSFCWHIAPALPKRASPCERDILNLVAKITGSHQSQTFRCTPLGVTGKTQHCDAQPVFQGFSGNR